MLFKHLFYHRIGAGNQFPDLVRHYVYCLYLDFIWVDKEHDLIPPVPELHGTVIPGGVKFREVNGISLGGQLSSECLGLLDPDTVSHGISSKCVDKDSHFLVHFNLNIFVNWCWGVCLKACCRIVFVRVTRRTRWPRIVISCEILPGYEGYRDLALKNCFYKDLLICVINVMRGSRFWSC